jgi:TetR/AcrR family transcriptional repressor of nem operon
MAKDETRAALLEHGTRLILAQGFNHTGVQDVLAAAGVPKGSFYHYFSTKDDFGLAVLQQYFDAHMATVERFLGDTRRPPLRRLRHCFDFYVDHFTARGCSDGCMLGNLSQELADQHPVFRARLQELMGRWTGRVADCLREARRNGDLDPAFDPQRLAEFCVTGWEGALLYMKASKDMRPVRNFLTLFFGMLQRPKAAGPVRNGRRAAKRVAARPAGRRD